LNRPDRLDTNVDHYQVLGVSRADGTASIRKAYLELARQHHPDRQRLRGGAGSAGVRVLMHEVNEAWRVLGNAELRRRYDGARRESVQSSDRVAAVSTTFRPVSSQNTSFKVGSRGVAAAVQYGPWAIGLVVLIAVFVFTAYAATSGDEPGAVQLDRWVVEGECITLFGPGNFAQAACDGPNDGVVVELRSDEACRRTDARAFEPRARAVVICLVDSAEAAG